MFSGPWVLKDLNKEKNVKKIEKKLHVLSKNVKTRDGKMLRPLNYHQKLRSNLFLKPKGGSLTPKAEKNQKRSKIFKKLEKIAK